MEIKDIEIKDIDLLDNVRQKPLGEDLSELMNSIKQNGLMQPIGVKEEKGGYILIWGFRRLTAFKKLGYKTIPAMIFLKGDSTMTETDFMIFNTTENIQRKEINYLELGRICWNLEKKQGLSVGEIAARLSISRAKVTNSIEAFIRVPETMRNKVVSMNFSRDNKQGKVSATIANYVIHAGLPEKDKVELFEWIIKEEIAVNKVKVLMDLLKHGLTLSQAKKECDKWEVVEIKLPISKAKVEELKQTEGDTLVSILQG